MRNRTSRFIIGAAMLVVLPVVAQASTARLEGMALPGDYTKDYTAIYSWPSSITGVGNLVYGELGSQLHNGASNEPSNTERAMGAVLPNLWDGRFGIWALHLREQTPALGQGDVLSGPNPGQGGADPNDHANEAFDLMWGKKFGTTSLGLRLDRSYVKGTDELPGVTTSFENDNIGAAVQGDPNLARNILGLGAGLGFNMSDKTTAEISLLWQNRNFEQDFTPTSKYEDNGGANYQFAGRMMWKWQPNVMVVPVVKYYNFDLSQKTENGANTQTFDNTLKGWQVGLAGNWALGSNDLFVLGATVAQNKLDQQFDVFNLNGGVLSGFNLRDTLTATETFSPQIFMALETQVNSWLTLRFGANKGAFHSSKIEGRNAGSEQPETITLKDSPFGMSLGASVKAGALTFDAVLDNMFYNDPLAQLVGGTSAANSGFSGNHVAFQKVSATYAW